MGHLLVVVGLFEFTFMRRHEQFDRKRLAPAMEEYAVNDATFGRNQEM